MPTPPATPLALRLVAPAAVVGILLAGLWFFAGRVTNDYEISIALSIAWFVVASMAFGRVTKARPDLRPWVRSATPRRPEQRNVQVAAGSVRSLAHSGRGTARVVELARGGRVLTLTRFDIDPGPQVEVRLVAGDDLGGRHRLLGDLKGTKGDQQYRIPPKTNLSSFDTVVFWCVPFTQALARADLRPS